MLLGLLGDVLDERDNRQQNRQRRQAPLFRARQYFELEDFHKRFRLTQEQVEDLMQNIGPQIEAQSLRASALSVQDKVLMTLRYFASGAIYTVIADASGPSPASVTRAVKCVTQAINAELFQRFICFPQNMGKVPRHTSLSHLIDLDALRLSFYNVNQPNGMPMVCGCVDATLINIIAPSEDEFQYVDRKNDHSINAMFICGPNLRFFAASVRWPGSVHDARVFRNSAVAHRFENGWRPCPDAVLLGDSGYKTRDYLLTPIANPQSAAERRYNASHRKTRRVIECAHRVFKNSFLCLKRLRHKDPVLCCEVIKACAVIHNLRTQEDYVGNLEEALNNMGLEMEDGEDDDVDDNGVAAGPVDDGGSDADENGNNVPPTQAASRAAALARLQAMVNTFRR